MKSIEKIIQQTDDQEVSKINWTNAWSKKYPVLSTYQEQVDIPKYAKEIRKMLSQLEQDYHFSKQDAMLVLFLNFNFKFVIMNMSRKLA